MSGSLPPPPFFDWSHAMDARDLILDQTHDLETGQPYPEPTTDRPSDEQAWEWVFEGACSATDGREVEPDGTCPHGHPAWPRRLVIV